MEEEEIHVPIPSFPIFKLRSSLIDKDPLIWVHMLEAYVKLIKLLLDRTQRERKLSVKSQQQLQAFLRAYLAETAQEENRIFSLGAVNPDIKKNSAILRTYIFQLIKDYSIVKLNLTGDATWNFILVYAKGNCTTVRSLVDGTHKSHFNNNKKSGNVGSIEPIQRHILKLIIDSKFKENDLEALSYLLGQNVHSSKSSSSFSVRTVSKVKPSALTFAELFVSKNWINSLEETFISEGNAHSDTVKQVMIVSLLSLSIAKVASLATKLGITNADSLKLCPLFSAIITSDGYKRLVPGLEERMVFLKSVEFSDEYPFREEDAYTENDINLLLELFPQLNKGKAITLLRENDGNVEATSNRIFEDPNLISQTAETTLNIEEKPSKYISDGKRVNVPKRSIYDGDKIGNLDFSDHSVIYGKRTLPDVNKHAHAPNELKNRTLDAALRIIYESDEDEPDDTYVDQEPTEGLGAMDNPSAGPSKEKLPVYDDDKNRTRSSEPESYLFAIYKEKGSSSFERSQRKSPGRQALKKDTKWSDEQIEGWYRMLLRSPKRFRMLEDDYLYNFRRRK